MRLLGLLVLLGAGPVARAQAPAWQMAVATGAGGGFTGVTASAVDASGNVYITGGFAGSIQFGATVLTSAGSQDVYVAKWSPVQASFVWARRAGGLHEDLPGGLAVSGTSVYVTGKYVSQQADFGAITLLNPWPLIPPYPTVPSTAAFVTKLTDSGAFEWAMSPGAGTSSYVAPVAGATGTVLYVVNGQSVDKLMDTGTGAVRTWRVTTNAFISALAANGSQVYIGGSFDTASLSLGATTLTNAFPYSAEIFVAKLVDAGPGASFAWARGATGSGAANDHISALAVRGADVYAAGFFQSSSIVFGTITRSGRFGQVFVGKLTDAGSSSGWVWVESGGPGGNPTLAVRGASLYIAGAFGYSTASFGSTTLTNAGTPGLSADVYVAKLTDAGGSGSWNWAQQSTGAGAGTATANSVAVSSTGVYVAGLATPPAAFGSFAITGSSPVGYLASLDEALVTATTTTRPLAAVSLLPNPAHGRATVQLPPIPGAATATLTILDALGRSVRAQTVPLPAAGLRHELDLTALPTGLYAVRVQAGGNSATRRLVVE